MKYRVCVLVPVCLALQILTAQSLITEDPADPEGPSVSVAADLLIGDSAEPKDLHVHGDTLLDGNLGLNGALNIGTSTTTPTSGAIRWTGSDFEGYDGSGWKSLTKTNFYYDFGADFKGSDNLASGIFSGVWGYRNLANGSYSTAWGSDNTASSTFSTAWGNSNLASGTFSTAWGADNAAKGYLSTAWGADNTVENASFATAWGYGNTASGSFATVSGYYNEASGSFAMVWGDRNKASNYSSTAWGMNNTASGSFATVSGLNNTAHGHTSTVWGQNNTATTFSTAWGMNNKAQKLSTTVWGFNNQANGQYATVWGQSNKAEACYVTVQGRFNIGGYDIAGGGQASWFETDPLFEIGAGTAEADRANALTVLKDGRVAIGKHNTLPNSASEDLQVQGSIKLGSSSGPPSAGAIRWTGSDFQGYNGSEWKSLTVSMPNGPQGDLSMGRFTAN